MISRLFPVVLILIAIGLFFAYINPTYSGNVQTLRTEIRGYDAALAAADVYTKKAAMVSEAKANLPEGALERLESFLPDGVDNVQLIVDLDALAKRSGITLSGFDVASPDEQATSGDSLSLEAEGAVESLDIRVKAVGKYDSFKTFLASAERSLRLLDLVELDLDDSETGIYTYNLTFRIYWLR